MNEGSAFSRPTPGERAATLCAVSGHRTTVPIEHIAKWIVVVRGQKVLLDSALAGLYGVGTKRLNEQGKRNLARFPNDFLFRLTPDEIETLNRSHFATGSQIRARKGRDPSLCTPAVPSRHTPGITTFDPELPVTGRFRADLDAITCKFPPTNAQGDHLRARECVAVTLCFQTDTEGPMTGADYRAMASEILDLIPLLLHSESVADLRSLADRYEQVARRLEAGSGTRPDAPLDHRRQVG